MKVGIYPGSFNPWHMGHEDVLQKASKVFDKIIIAKYGDTFKRDVLSAGILCEVEEICFKDKLLVDLATEYNVDAVIRGLRNGNDLQYEMNQQYWNEDLGLYIPTVYFITDRKLSHISSSAIREIQCIKEKQ